MARPEYRSYEISGQLEPVHWAALVEQLGHVGLSLLETSDGADIAEHNEEDKPAVWMTHSEFYAIGAQEDVPKQLVGRAWLTLAKLEAIKNQPHIAHSMFWFRPTNHVLPVRFKSSESGQGLMADILVDAASLGTLVEEIDKLVKARGVSAIPEYLGINQCGPGVVNFWRTVVSRMTAGIDS